MNFSSDFRNEYQEKSDEILELLSGHHYDKTQVVIKNSDDAFKIFLTNSKELKEILLKDLEILTRGHEFIYAEETIQGINECLDYMKKTCGEQFIQEVLSNEAIKREKSFILTELLEDGRLKNFITFINENYDKESAKDILANENIKKELIRNINYHKEDIIKFIKENYSKEDAKEFFINENIKEILIQELVNSLKNKDIDKAKYLIAIVKDNFNDEIWNGKNNVLRSFKEGSEYFGDENILKYISGKNADGYNTLINIKSICKLCDKFGTDKKSNHLFFNNILEQVKIDISFYQEGASYDYLDSIANKLGSINFNDIIDNAKILQNNIPEISKLTKSVYSQEKIFASWKNLKKFMNLCELVREKEFIKCLQEMRKTNEKLFDYINVLLFNESSHVPIKIIKDFCMNPYHFF